MFPTWSFPVKVNMRQGRCSVFPLENRIRWLLLLPRPGTGRDHASATSHPLFHRLRCRRSIEQQLLDPSSEAFWDYLSYTFRNPGRFNGVRFKTLYELQLVSIRSDSDSPNEEAIVNSGTTAFLSQSSFLASGTKKVFMPTFGGELEQEMGKHFRWEVLASGFGLPHHGVIWDGQADIALRLGKQRLFSVIAPSTLRRLHRPLISTTRKPSRALSLGSATICFEEEEK